MKFCKHCGNEVLDDAIVCPKCGCSVDYGNGGIQPQAELDSCSGLSIAGFVLSFLESFIGLILSIVAYNEAKRTGSQKSLSLARAGIIISAVLLGLAVIFGIIYVVFILMVLMGAALM